MRVWIIAYVPPDKLPYAKAFKTNITHYKTEWPIHLFDDSVGDPEKYTKEGEHFRLTNWTFLQAMRIADEARCDYMIFMEADSRVGCHAWDRRIIDEFMAWPGAICGGTPVVWNFNRTSPELTKRTIRYAHHYQSKTGLPMAFHGQHGYLKGSKVEGHHPYCLYPSGGVGIYEMDFLRRSFPNFKDEGDPGLDTAWDMQVGFKLHEFYGEDIVKKCAGLSCSFSGYMDEVLSLEERMESLQSGRFVAVHQIKTEDECIYDR